MAERAKAAALSASVNIITLYLRHEYLAAGVSDDDVLDELSGQELSTSAFHVQSSAELLKHAAAACAPALEGFVQ